MRHRRGLRSAAGLFVLTPLVAEFVPGYISIDRIVGAVVLAPMYGGGALLIREVVRRTGRGWWTILLLALAYGLVEEGVVTQSLFNPDYAGLALHEPAYLAGVELGGWWTVFVLLLHVVWSIAVPIALVETLLPDRRTTPWLGKAGLVITGLLFVLGAGVMSAFTLADDPFVASPAQFAGVGIAVLVVVVLAFAVGHRLEAQVVEQRRAPSAWLVGAVSLVASSLVAGSAFLVTGGSNDHLGWILVGGYLVLAAVVIAAVRYWSASPGWGAGQRLALAGGALLTYVWNAFPETPPELTDPGVDLVGNLLFGVGALALLVFAIRRVTGSEGP